MKVVSGISKFIRNLGTIAIFGDGARLRQCSAAQTERVKTNGNRFLRGVALGSVRHLSQQSVSIRFHTFRFAQRGMTQARAIADIAIVPKLRMNLEFQKRLSSSRQFSRYLPS